MPLSCGGSDDGLGDAMGSQRAITTQDVHRHRLSDTRHETPSTHACRAYHALVVIGRRRAHITRRMPEGSSMQEVGKQLFHDLGLVNGDEVIGIVDDLDARLGQPLAETDCRLRPIVERFVSADDR